ncbi:MAG: hypothetical protein Q8K30_05995 [Candidatus Gracilibacteria bacterium]|nr:hypothetical protein [Candidatus Gracilibacteria bacterium]
MKSLKIIFIIAITSFLFGNTFAASIDNITAIDNNTVQLTISNDVVISDTKVEGDIKLLKDIPVSFSVKDTENAKKVLVNLSSDLISNTSYSLITILGGEGNIDFKIGDFLEGEFVNSNLLQGEKGISKVKVIDSRTLEIYFTDALVESNFEFKILSEVALSEIKSAGSNKLDLEVAKNIEKSSNYIVMVLSLTDASGKKITFDEDLYDLVTPADLVQEVEELAVTVAQVQPEPMIETSTGNLEEVAKNVDRTPDTGTTSIILLMLALIGSIAFFYRKNLVK